MNDYKERMIEEYKQLAERFIKLGRLIEKHNSGTLDFKPTCPLLVRRATIEGIDLDDIKIEAGETE